MEYTYFYPWYSILVKDLRMIILQILIHIRHHRFHLCSCTQTAQCSPCITMVSNGNDTNCRNTIRDPPTNLPVSQPASQAHWALDCTAITLKSRNTKSLVTHKCLLPPRARASSSPILFPHPTAGRCPPCPALIVKRQHRSTATLRSFTCHLDLPCLCPRWRGGHSWTLSAAAIRWTFTAPLYAHIFFIYVFTKKIASQKLFEDDGVILRAGWTNGRSV